MFLDDDEEKEVKELIKTYEANPNSDWMGSGSMLIIFDGKMEAYEVYTLRGHVKVV